MLRAPNILWILTTQWRGQAAGFMGDPNASTPRLDALAARSLRFTQAVSPHPFGPFSRAALFTGKTCPENGLRDYYDFLKPDQTTIASVLAREGYRTAFFGKWHLSQRDPSAPLVGEAHARQFVPLEQRGGFSDWEGFESGFLINDPWLHGTDLPEPQRFHGYQSDVLCKRLERWLDYRLEEDAREQKPRPWFCVLSLEPPHPPYDAPSAGFAPKDPASLFLRPNVPLGGEVEALARSELSGYYAHIEATDHALGHLLATKGLSRAIVVFASVHGDMHGSHGLFRKGWPHEESIRVPLTVRGPLEMSYLEHGKLVNYPVQREGIDRDDPVSIVDLHRWTLEWATRGWRAPGAGAAFVRCSMPSVVNLPRQCDRRWTALRNRKRKLVLNEDGSPWLLFDLENDPFEMRNLAGDPTRAGDIEALSHLLKA